MREIITESFYLLLCLVLSPVLFVVFIFYMLYSLIFDRHNEKETLDCPYFVNDKEIDDPFYK